MFRRVSLLATAFTLTTSALVAVSVAPTVPGVPAPGHAAALNTVNILFDRPGNTPTFGPNELVEIVAGNINYIGGDVRIIETVDIGGVPTQVPRRVPACSANAAGTGERQHPGVDDYLQPFADIYIIPSGQDPLNNEKIVDRNGAPNTVFGGLGGSFLYEPLGLTFPTGKISAGVYGIVVDECQNGYFDTGEDTYIDDAFFVDLDQDVPPLSPSAAQFVSLKEKARKLNTGIWTLEQLMKLKEVIAKAKEVQGIAQAAISVEGFAVFAINQAVGYVTANSPYNVAKARAETAIKTAITQHRTRIRRLAADPPQTDFQRPATPTTANATSEHSDDPVEEAFALYVANHDALSGVSGALLDAIERYQGADQAGDAQWALRHARRINELVALYQQLQPGFDDAEAAVSTSLSPFVPGSPDYVLADRIYFIRSVERANDAIENLDSEGFAVPDIELQHEVLNSNTDPEFAATRREDWQQAGFWADLPDEATEWIEVLDGVGAAVDEFAGAVDGFDDLATTLIPPLEAQVTDTDLDPQLAFTVTGAAQAGATVGLSIDAPDDELVYRWDLDGDGSFGDATGPDVDLMIPGDTIVGAPLLVSVEATGSSAEHDTATVLVIVVAGGNVAPIIDNATVDGAPPTVAEVAPGSSVDIAVTASDADGDALTYEWLVNGQLEPGETSSSFTFTTNADALGTYFIEVIVSDGDAETRRAFFVWTVTEDLDADRFFASPGPDCLDDPAVEPGPPFAFFVNPRGTETVNNFDDDCDGIVDDVAAGNAFFQIRGPFSDDPILSTLATEGTTVRLVPDWIHPNNSGASQDNFRLTVDWDDGTVDSVDVAWDPGSSEPQGGTRPDMFHEYGDQLPNARIEFCFEWLDDPAPDPISGNERRCHRADYNVFNDRPIVNPTDFRTWSVDQPGGPTSGFPPTGEFLELDPTGKALTAFGNVDNWVVRTSNDLLGIDGYGRVALSQDHVGPGDDDQLGVLFGFDATYDVDPGANNGPEGEFFDPNSDVIGLTWYNDGNTFPGGLNYSTVCNDAPDGATADRPDPFTLWRRHGDPAFREDSNFVTFDFPYDPSDDASDDGGVPQDPRCSDGPNNGLEVLASVPTSADPDDFVTANGWLPRGFAATPTAVDEPYMIEYDYQPDGIRVWVNGVMQLDWDNPDPIGDPLPPSHLSVVYKSQGQMNLSATAPTPVFSFVQGRGGEFDPGGTADGISVAMHDGADDEHEARIDWGDGSATTEGTVVADPAMGPGWFTISGDHVYERAGTFTGEVCATDDEGLASCSPFVAEVSNLAPSVAAGPDIAVGADVELSDITFQDPGPFDTHTVTVDWGEGDGPVSAGVSVDAVRGGGVVTASHTFTTGGDTTVEVCVTDQLGAEACDSRVLHVRIVDSTPVLSVGDGDPGVEAGEFFLDVAWSDANVDETHTVTVDWGDGSGPETVPVLQSHVGCTNRNGDDPTDIDADCRLEAIADAVHVYDDDDDFEVTVTVEDSDGRIDTETVTAAIANVAPGVVLDAPVVDGVVVSLSGSYGDVSAVDTHRVVVDWGDGTTSDDALTGGVIDVSHTYAVKGDYDIEVCVIDDDGGETCLQALGEPDVAFIVATEPARFADTRPDRPTVDGQNAGGGKLAPGETTRIQITGRGDIPPSGVNAAVLNIASVAPDQKGFFTVYPCTPERPTASALNYLDDNRANEIIAKVSDSGQVCVFNLTPTHLLLDVVGYVPTGSDYVETTPARFADTRPDRTTVDGQNAGGGKLAPGETIEIQITGRGDIPPGTNVDSAVINIASVAPDQKGFFTVYPCTPERPTASALNYLDDNRANEIITKLSPTGSVCVFSLNATHLLLDVVGYVPGGSDYTGIEPARLVDTRPNRPTIDNQNAGTGKLEADQTIEIQVTGRGTIPTTGIDAAVINIASVAPDQKGFFTVYPCTPQRPTASALNYLDDNRANEIITKLSPTGTICIYTSKPTHLLLDIVGHITT